jgi:FlaA1/EpsC-like NDP-sugar epimerase
MNNRIVIFGASGFLGTHLVERLSVHGKTNIVAVGRNEAALVSLKEKFPFVEIQVGDIANKWTVKKAMKDADEVYHLAALKHVGLADIHVQSTINTNVIGCMNVVEESLVVKPKIFLFVSTDKAGQPTGVYGCTKKIGERLIAEAEKMNPDTKYSSVRYGNVWNSAGSIATKWKPKMEKGEEVIITDLEASRFFWTVDEAVDLIFECIEKSKDSTPYIPKMKAVKMGVVLDACMEVWGKSPFKIIGLQPGENKVETTDGIIFSDQVEQFTRSEFIEKFLKHG